MVGDWSGNNSDGGWILSAENIVEVEAKVAEFFLFEAKCCGGYGSRETVRFCSAEKWEEDDEEEEEHGFWK